MNRKHFVVVLAVVSALLLSVGGVVAQDREPQSPQNTSGTAFTYQGQLKNVSGPVTGNCDFNFSLWNSQISLIGQIGTTQSKTNVAVTNGLFTVQLDFGASAFGGDARWLQIAVKCAGDAGYTTLIPRQALTPTPYALHAADAWSINGNSGTNPNANFLGTTDNLTLTVRVSNTVAYRFVPAVNSGGRFAPNIVGDLAATSSGRKYPGPRSPESSVTVTCRICHWKVWGCGRQTERTRGLPASIRL